LTLVWLAHFGEDDAVIDRSLQVRMLIVRDTFSGSSSRISVLGDGELCNVLWYASGSEIHEAKKGLHYLFSSVELLVLLLYLLLESVDKNSGCDR
jgi:hypothetical protein